MTAYNLPSSRIDVIPNGVGLPTAVRRLRHVAHNQPIVLLFVGQLSPVKQVHRAIEALADLPEQVTLRLVYHHNARELQLREQARRLGVQERVIFVGQRCGPALVEEYDRAHALVLPSASEALPSVVIEAILTGLPILASAVGGVPEQIGNAGVLVTPSSADSLAPAISTLLADYAGYARRATARAHSVAVEYSVERMIGRHLDLYRRLTERSRR
jgi:glycosyltransferase involved in cell wall biosynthesis